MGYHVRVNGTVVDKNVLVAFTIRGGRNSIDTQPSASGASLTFWARNDPMTWLRADAQLTVTIDPPTGLRDLYPATIWTGTVADIERSVTRTKTRTGTTIDHIARISATGELARLGRIVIGDTPWPKELDGPRMARIIKDAGYPVQDPDPATQMCTDPAIWVKPGTPGGSWYTDGTPTDVVITHTPGTLTFKSPFVTRTWDNIDKSWSWDSTDPKQIWTGQRSYNTLNYHTPISVRGKFRLGMLVTFATASPVTIYAWSAVRPADANIGNPKAKSTIVAVPEISAGGTVLISPVVDIPDDHRAVTFRINTYATTTYRWVGVYQPTCDPGTVNLIPRDVDRQPATQPADTAAKSAGGVLSESRYGTPVYADAYRRTAGTTPDVVIPASAISGAALRRETSAERINRQTVTYGEAGESEQPSLTIDHAWSIDEYGEYSDRRTTDLATLEEAATFAINRINNRDRVTANWDALPVLLDSLDEYTVYRLLTARHGAQIKITGLDAAAYGMTTWLGFLEAFTLTTKRRKQSATDRTGDVLTLRLSDLRDTAQLFAWQDLAADLTWLDLDPDYIWNDATDTAKRKV